MPLKKALITGVAGQDGSYLAELLLEKGYEVHGLVRRQDAQDPQQKLPRILHLLDRIHLHAASLENYSAVKKLVASTKPDECYHLAAHSFVYQHVEDEISSLTSNIQSTHHLLAAIKDSASACRFYFAASSEIFGNAAASPQNELTPFHPRSAYGISKAAGFELTRNYRESHKLFAVSGITYNHESPRRGFEYVTRKITSHAARIKLGSSEVLSLGNLDAQRDWGHANDYVKGMWLMLQQYQPDDFVLATGRLHSVRDFCHAAFKSLGLDWEKHVVVDPQFFRPAEPTPLCGQPTKARHKLAWFPQYTFQNLVLEMVQHDLKLASAQLASPFTSTAARRSAA